MSQIKITIADNQQLISKWCQTQEKRDSYRRFVGGMPVQFTGFKLFYQNDKLNAPYKLMTPAEILNLYPKPIYIQYQ